MIMNTTHRDATGTAYRITEAIKINNGKNFGKTLYRLTDAEGNRFVAMAKGSLKINSRISPNNH